MSHPAQIARLERHAALARALADLLEGHPLAPVVVVLAWEAEDLADEAAAS